VTRPLALQLLRFYPRAWRQRYEGEVRALLDERPVVWRDIRDLLAGSGREWLRVLYGPASGVRLRLVATALMAGLCVEAAAFGVARFWQEWALGTPSLVVTRASHFIPTLALVAMILSFAMARRAQYWIAAGLVALIFVAALTDRLTASPMWFGYFVPPVVLLVTFLGWEASDWSPYPIRPWLDLRGRGVGEQRRRPTTIF
jgi:hypothetical protein